MLWAHDYHLLLFARAMRQRGHSGPMGHFLHIPFPSLDMFSMLPWSAQILDSLDRAADVTVGPDHGLSVFR